MATFSTPPSVSLRAVNPLTFNGNVHDTGPDGFAFYVSNCSKPERRACNNPASITSDTNAAAGLTARTLLPPPGPPRRPRPAEPDTDDDTERPDQLSAHSPTGPGRQQRGSYCQGQQEVNDSRITVRTTRKALPNKGIRVVLPVTYRREPGPSHRLSPPQPARRASTWCLEGAATGHPSPAATLLRDVHGGLGLTEQVLRVLSGRLTATPVENGVPPAGGATRGDRGAGREPRLPCGRRRSRRGQLGDRLPLTGLPVEGKPGRHGN